MSFDFDPSYTEEYIEGYEDAVKFIESVVNKSLSSKTNDGFIWADDLIKGVDSIIGSLHSQWLYIDEMKESLGYGVFKEFEKEDEDNLIFLSVKINNNRRNV